jgi:hypothetical protein
MALKRVCAPFRPLPLSPTRLTLARTVWADVGVRLVVEMSRAAVCSTCVHRRRREAAPRVLGVRNQRQVRRIHAGRIAAQVVALHTDGDCTARKFPCDAVRAQHPTLRWLCAQQPIVGVVACAPPGPTVVRRACGGVLPEPNSERS